MTTIGRWSPTKVRNKIIDGSWVSETRYAMELIAPSSIAFAGTSADIVGLGSVDFSAVTSLSLNGVFSTEYDNYMVSVRFTSGNANRRAVFVRFRLSGSDNSDSNSYVTQLLFVPTAGGDGTVIGAARQTDTRGRLFRDENDNLRQGATSFIYGPALAQPTAWRTVGAVASSSAGIEDLAGTHNVSTAYDGFTITPEASNLTGNVAVYGLRG